jgi:hypothetical protein
MIREEELQEIEGKHKQASEKLDGTTMIELGNIEVPKLIAEVRRLNEERTEIIKEMDFAQLHKNYNTRAEKYHYLEKENQRLKKENGLLRNTSPLMCTMQLEQANQRYKQALEEIVNQHDKPYSDRWTLADIAQKALKGETNDQ